VDLDSARDLKRKLREAALSSAPFATGISLTPRAGEYRVAILLTNDRARTSLQSPGLRPILHREARHVDIEVAGSLRPATANHARRPVDGVVRIGASVGHDRGGVGSIGFFAVRRSDGVPGIVSCNHVIAMADQAADGDAVVSPARMDGGTRVIASIDGAYPRLDRQAAADCAFATLRDGVAYDASTLDGGALDPGPAVISANLEVTKVGRVTPARAGVITKIEIDDVWMRYGLTRIAFHDVIQVGSTSAQRFCDYGDSGALVYTTATFRPVGLLFATSATGGPYDMGWTWVHPISRVLDALHVDLAGA
jgi:hypothetical protein